jgi:putative FmdB family regulatory protein
MPLYEYQCAACGQRFEVIQKFSDPPADTCRVCGKGPVERLASSPAIQFKGTGWYITDYAKKSGTDSSPTTKPGSSSGGETKSDAASASSGKSDATPASTTPTTSKE